MFRSIAICVMAVALAGCSALNFKRAVDAEDLSTIKRIGVMSSLGNIFHGESIGTTVFNNTYFTEPVPEWKIDAFATSKAVDALRSNGKYEVAALNLEGIPPGKIGRGDDTAMWEAAKKQGFDKLVLLSPGVSDNFTVFKPGYGLHEQGLFFTTPWRCVYAGFVIGVFDVATYKSIAWEWGGGQNPCKPQSSNDIPFKKRFSDYSAVERKLVRERLEKRLADSIPYTLGELALIPETAPPTQ